MEKYLPFTLAILWRRVDALRQREQVHDRRGLLARRGRHRRHLHLLLPRHLGLPVDQVHEVSHFMDEQNFLPRVARIRFSGIAHVFQSEGSPFSFAFVLLSRCETRQDEGERCICLP